ncbi:hypothetical protein [Emticicia agri]|uniref:Alpha/beta hydrolase n=1 Tax=Emticicia agri TaxID=2492393 RepID=A0A4Q5LU81_9BACT|nr:hypothetical protein [Emticicia agri]RYU93029.1 hypothetical protein EWM59_24070 [Emticicia agri]
MKKLLDGMPLFLFLLSAFQAFSQDKSPTTENPPFTYNFNPNPIYQSITNLVTLNPDAPSCAEYGDVPVSLYAGMGNTGDK